MSECSADALEPLYRRIMELEDLLKERIGGFFEPIQKLMDKNQELEKQLEALNQFYEALNQSYAMVEKSWLQAQNDYQKDIIKLESRLAKTMEALKRYIEEVYNPSKPGALRPTFEGLRKFLKEIEEENGIQG